MEAIHRRRGLFLFFFFAGDAEQTAEEWSEAEVYIRAVLLWEMIAGEDLVTLVAGGGRDEAWCLWVKGHEEKAKVCSMGSVL